MEKVESLLNIKFDSEPVYGDNDKYIKIKIGTYGRNTITNFQGKSMPKEKAPCKCSSIIMLDSVIKTKKKYYPQTFLGECKYEAKKIKIESLIDDDLERKSSNESGSKSDNDSNDEAESDDVKDNDESNEEFVKS